MSPVSLSAVNASSVPLTFRAHRWVRRALGRDAQEIRDAEEFERDQAAGKTVRRPCTVQDHYDEKADLVAFEKGREAFRGCGRKAVPLRNDLTAETIADLIRLDPQIRAVVDFGCHYGGLSNKIATAFPHIQIIATDRSERVMELNRAEFSQPNLRFIGAKFIADRIAKEPEIFRDAIFTHTYTTMFLLPAAIREIYAALHAAGCRYVVAHEQSGLSYHSLRQFRFAYEPRPSTWHRGGILLHNYPEILQTAGFDVIDTQSHRLVNTGQMAGWRSVIFTGKRR